MHCAFACSLNSMTYITGVEECCIGDSCLDQTSFKALIDCGTSFTHFPGDVYGIVVKEVPAYSSSTVIFDVDLLWSFLMLFIHSCSLIDK